MSNFIQTFIFFVLLFSLCPDSAFAHRPYLKKQAIVHDNQGQRYILETWNGDGIFFVDPYVIQMRDQRGFIVARGGWSLIFLCPSLEYCWSLGLFPIRFNSDEIRSKSLEYSLKGTPYMPESKYEQEEFVKYMGNEKVLYTPASWMNYPEEDKASETHFGTSIENPLLFPIFWVLYLCLIVFYKTQLYLPALLKPLFSARSKESRKVLVPHKKGGWVEKSLYNLWDITAFIYSGFFLIYAFVCLIYIQSFSILVYSIIPFLLTKFWTALKTKMVKNKLFSFVLLYLDTGIKREHSYVHKVTKPH